MSNMKNDTNRITSRKCSRVKINNRWSDSGEIAAALVIQNEEWFPARLLIPFFDWKYSCLKNSFPIVFHNVTVWRVLRKHLYLKTYKLFIVQCWMMNSLYAFKYKCFRNTRYVAKLGIPLESSFWNALHYQWKYHWTVIISGKIPCFSMTVHE
jgi:hypothetical protein